MFLAKIPKFFVCTLITISMVFITSCGGSSDTIVGPNISEGRWGHTATKLTDGKVLIVGGQAKPSKPLDSAEIFDPVSLTFSSAGKMSAKRGDGLSSVLLNSGDVLVFGDTDDGSAELYDPASGTWSPTGSLNAPRAFASADLLDDGRVLVSGGTDVTKSGDVQFASSEIYNPVSGQWEITGDMVEVHSGHSSVLVNGKVVIFGKTLAEMYDPETGVWSSVGVPAVERNRGTSTIILQNGKVMIAGGEWKQPGWQGQVHVMATIQTFDPSTNVFSSSEIPSMAAPHIYQSTFLQDDGVLVVGTAGIEIYNPTTKLWTEVATFTADRGTDTNGAPSGTKLDDGRILVIGGKTETDDGKYIGIATSEIYDPSLKE